MDDIITQEELDALYGAIEQATRKAVAQAGREGEPEEQTVQLYDFRVAHRFPQEQVRQLQRQFRGFERLCNANLSTFLRCPVQITLASVDQMG